MKPPDLKTWQSITIGMILGAIILAAGLLISLPDRMSPIVILPTTTISPIQVYVVGEIKEPGVVQISLNSRIQDVINAAGGATENADLSQLNLAARVSDGQKVVVPEVGKNLITQSTALPQSSIVEIPTISINSASQKEFEKLPGIGEEKAKAIISEREKRGRFQSIDEVSQVPGITQNIFIQIRPYLCLD
jgi:competence protein ComEA